MFHLQFHTKSWPSACTREMNYVLGRTNKQVLLPPQTAAYSDPVSPGVQCPKDTESICFYIIILFHIDRACILDFILNYYCGNNLTVNPKYELCYDLLLFRVLFLFFKKLSAQTLVLIFFPPYNYLQQEISGWTKSMTLGLLFQTFNNNFNLKRYRPL